MFNSILAKMYRNIFKTIQNNQCYTLLVKKIHLNPEFGFFAHIKLSFQRDNSFRQ